MNHSILLSKLSHYGIVVYVLSSVEKTKRFCEWCLFRYPCKQLTWRYRKGLFLAQIFFRSLMGINPSRNSLISPSLSSHCVVMCPFLFPIFPHSSLCSSHQVSAILFFLYFVTFIVGSSTFQWLRLQGKDQQDHQSCHQVFNSIFPFYKPWETPNKLIEMRLPLAMTKHHVELLIAILPFSTVALKLPIFSYLKGR